MVVFSTVHSLCQINFMFQFFRGEILHTRPVILFSWSMEVHSSYTERRGWFRSYGNLFFILLNWKFIPHTWKGGDDLVLMITCSLLCLICSGSYFQVGDWQLICNCLIFFFLKFFICSIYDVKQIFHDWEMLTMMNSEFSGIRFRSLCLVGGDIEELWSHLSCGFTLPGLSEWCLHKYHPHAKQETEALHW